MNNQARKSIPVTQEHYLYQSNQHLENDDHTTYDELELVYDENTPIATV